MEARDTLSAEGRSLYELLKSVITNDLDRKLKEQHDDVLASVSKVLDSRFNALSSKLDSMREDIGVDLGQIRLEKDKEACQETGARISSPPTP